jgi:hypothetical protein
MTNLCISIFISLFEVLFEKLKKILSKVMKIKINNCKFFNFIQQVQNWRPELVELEAQAKEVNKGR